MTAENLFYEAIARSSGERAAFLDKACAGQPQLRAAVDTLLEAHEAAGGPLNALPSEPGQTIDSAAEQDRGPATEESLESDSSTPPQAVTTDYHPDVQPGAVIARRYTLVKRIGEGGMGEVWVAKQTEPVKRKVALKVIKMGMDSRAVLSRFEQERQALAMMDHPNIARVLDGGMTPTGQPFFVMELVNGLPLNKFCDEVKLTPKQRLELFVPICHAVQHAHQKGIIHRDLKPANILVGLIDAKPVPKVIDFGVAKATAGRLTDESLSTQFGAVLGTLEYMSPEQAGLAGDDIDTRADIYSLGVILYELLTGLRPIDAKRLRRAALTELIRIIQEEEPSRPSTRLSADESAPSLAALRQTEPKRLMAMLRGELDWVVLKCLEKQRERRYETANGLARDIQRYLADEVVEARPPSAGYRLQKFVRRNKGRAIAASLVLFALLAGMAGTAWQAIRAERAWAEETKQREIAQDNEKKATAAAAEERLAKERESAERDRAEQAYARTADVLDTMVSEVTGDSLATQKEVTPEQKKFLTEVLTYYQEFAGVKSDDANTRRRTARAAYRVGEIESRLGRKEEAATAFRKALDHFAALTNVVSAVPDDRRDLAKSHSNLGRMLWGLGERPAAEHQYRKALDIQEKLAAEFPAVPDYRQGLARTQNSLGLLLRDLGNRPEAAEQHGMGVALQEKLAAEFPAVPDYRQDLANSHHNLGNLLVDLGKGPEAEQQYRKAVAIKEELTAEFPAVPAYRLNLSKSHQSLGGLLESLGSRPEAEHQFQKALAIAEALAAEFPAVPDYRKLLAASHNDLGSLMKNQAAAEEQYRKALAIQEKLATDFPNLPEHRSDVSMGHYNLGLLLHQTGKPTEADEQYRKALAIQEKLVAEFPAVPDYRRQSASSHNNLAALLATLGKRSEAEVQHRQALVLQEKLAADFPSVPLYRVELGGSYCNFGNLVNDGGQPSESLELYGKAIANLAPIHVREPRDAVARRYLMFSHQGRAIALDRLQQYSESITDWDKAIELCSIGEQPRYRSARATSRVKAGQVAEAVAEVAELTKNPFLPAGAWYNFACIYAIAGGKVADQKDEYTKRAVELLQQAVKAGFNDAAHIKDDADIDSLREREDFRKLLQELEKQ